MGVIYQDGNVVTRLLVPYVRRKGCLEPPDTIRAVYHACSRGEISTDDLWAQLGVSGDASDADYCRSHLLRRRCYRQAGAQERPMIGRELKPVGIFNAVELGVCESGRDLTAFGLREATSGFDAEPEAFTVVHLSITLPIHRDRSVRR